jgi:pimeloyl-ACP methyl ester carboxylesterase
MGIVLSILKWSAILLAVLLLIGLFYEQLSRWQLERKFLPGKTFVTINGKPVHYVKKGAGNCTVVFMSGMGSSHSIWQEVQDSLSQEAVTITYDRNGLMFSDDAAQPMTNDHVTAELEMLLAQTNCPKPYILVGHSMAGIYLRPFINAHAEDIAGVLFVEAAHPQQIKKSSAALKGFLKPPPTWLIRFVVESGIYRTYFSFAPISPEIPMGHRLHQFEKDFFYRSYERLLEEVAHDELNFADAEKYTSFGNIPLTVIMGTSEQRYTFLKDTALRDEYRGLVREVQADLLKLSGNSRLVEAPNSGHLLQINDNALLAAEIRKHL